jgi:hypothetical protein
VQRALRVVALSVMGLLSWIGLGGDDEKGGGTSSSDLLDDKRSQVAQVNNSHPGAGEFACMGCSYPWSCTGSSQRRGQRFCRVSLSW